MNLLSTYFTLCLLLLTASASPTYPRAAISLRIEGATTTIFEGLIATKPHNVTTPSGGTHKCDGTNNNNNPTPGPTLTGALDDAARLNGFTWDGTWSPTFEDFFITRIADSENTATEFWGLLEAYQFTQVGGCQQQVKNRDEVLIAYNAFNANAFLKLSSSESMTKKGVPVVVTVTNGATGAPIAGAKVGGGTTGADGTVAVTFGEKGVKKLKAEKEGTVRSNEVQIFVR